jgi:hypothetical protein
MTHARLSCCTGTVNQSSCPWLRKSFTLPSGSTFSSTSHDEDDGSNSSSSVALAYVASVGYHELWVNGQKVNEDVLSPSVSDLAKRVLLRTYDVSAFLKPGEVRPIVLSNKTCVMYTVSNKLAGSQTRSACGCRAAGAVRIPIVLSKTNCNNVLNDTA